MTIKNLQAVEEEVKIDLEVDPVLQELINYIHNSSVRNGYKVIWVYYRFKDECRNSLQEISLGTWRYLGEKLSYKKGWAWIKWQESQAQTAVDVAAELNKASPNIKIYTTIDGEIGPNDFIDW